MLLNEAQQGNRLFVGKCPTTAVRLMIPELEARAHGQWRWLVERPHPWRRQVWIKGRKLLASAVWLDTLTNGMGPREAAEKIGTCLCLVEESRARNPRIFGSVQHGRDSEGSDLDLLIDPLPGATLFDLGGLQVALEDLLGIRVAGSVIGHALVADWFAPLLVLTRRGRPRRGEARPGPNNTSTPSQILRS